MLLKHLQNQISAGNLSLSLNNQIFMANSTILRVTLVTIDLLYNFIYRVINIIISLDFHYYL